MSLGLLTLYAHNVWAEPATDVSGCRTLANDAERLRCYDASKAAEEQLPGTPASPEPDSALEQRIKEERDLGHRMFAMLPHRPNYFLHTYSRTPNTAPYVITDPTMTLDNQELKYQLSLRVPLWNNLFGKNGDLWVAYTQQSYWQAYNWSQSAPFRETNYEPELGLSFDTDFRLLGLKHRVFAVGLAHQSNGRSEPLSRSWNRVWANFSLERGNFALTLKPWYRIPESAVTDDNPDIESYAGRGELRAVYKIGKQVISCQLHNSLRSRDNRSGYQLDWSFPLIKQLKGLVQYYNGYGENLIDYNVRTYRIGIGVLIADWL